MLNKAVIRPHRMHRIDAACCYRCLTYSVVCLSVCLLGTPMTCASAAELIEMLFDDRLVWVGLTHGLDWVGLGPL